jgi:hypothetical protein
VNVFQEYYMGGAIHIGVRRSADDFETVSVWTNDLNLALHSAEFLDGDVTPLEEHLRSYKGTEVEEHGYGAIDNDPGGSYGYVFIDYLERRIVSASNYQPVSSILGVSLEVDHLLGDDRRRKVAADLILRLRHRFDMEGNLVEVGPYSAIEQLTADPDFSHKNAYEVTSPYWTLEDVWPHEGGYTILRDLVRHAPGRLTYSEEIAWSKVTGDRQPVIDY